MPACRCCPGAGSATWVERRLRLGDETVVVEAGACRRSGHRSATRSGAPPAASPPRSHAVTPRRRRCPSAAADPSPTVEPTPSRRPPRVASPEPPAPAPATTSTRVADPTGPIGGDRLAALRAAMRVHDAATGTPDVADADGCRRAARSSSPSTTRSPSPRTTRRPTERLGRPTEPTAGHASRSRRSRRADEHPVRPGRSLCARGHVNPIHVSVCQTCGDLLDVGAPTETIRQPPLAMLELPSGEAIADRPATRARPAARPRSGAGRSTRAQSPWSWPTTRRCRAPTSASTSRTGRSRSTDCGSRSGTAIVVRPGEEPRILEPWVTHELPVGARLFLGGPTSVVDPTDPHGGRWRLTWRSPPSGGHDLVVEFAGDERVLSPGDELTFGRSADLVIDENRYLHRLIGRFTWSNGMWWLVNTGSSIALRLADAAGPSYAKVAPGHDRAAGVRDRVLTFEAGAGRTNCDSNCSSTRRCSTSTPTSPMPWSRPTPSTSRRRRRRARSRSTTSSDCCSSRCASRGSTTRRPNELADEPPDRGPARLDDHEVQPQARLAVSEVRQRRRLRPAGIERPARPRPPGPARRARARHRHGHRGRPRRADSPASRATWMTVGSRSATSTPRPGGIASPGTDRRLDARHLEEVAGVVRAQHEQPPRPTGEVEHRARRVAGHRAVLDRGDHAEVVVVGELLPERVQRGVVEPVEVVDEQQPRPAGRARARAGWPDVRGRARGRRPCRPRRRARGRDRAGSTTVRRPTPRGWSPSTAAAVFERRSNGPTGVVRRPSGSTSVRSTTTGAPVMSATPSGTCSGAVGGPGEPVDRQVVGQRRAGEHRRAVRCRAGRRSRRSRRPARAPTGRGTTAAICTVGTAVPQPATRRQVELSWPASRRCRARCSRSRRRGA